MDALTKVVAVAITGLIEKLYEQSKKLKRKLSYALVSAALVLIGAYLTLESSISLISKYFGYDANYLRLFVGVALLVIAYGFLKAAKN